MVSDADPRRPLISILLLLLVFMSQTQDSLLKETRPTSQSRSDQWLRVEVPPGPRHETECGRQVLLSDQLGEALGSQASVRPKSLLVQPESELLGTQFNSAGELHSLVRTLDPGNQFRHGSSVRVR